MLRTTGSIGSILWLLIGVGGCGQQTVQSTSSHKSPPVIEKSKYVLTEEPDGGIGVMIAREDSIDQDEIVLVGRIGGRKNPWIEGRAAFTVIDAALTVVEDGEESSDDQVCMDDCCASLRADCTMLVKIVDEQGWPLAIDARELLDVKENDMVVVKGKVQRDEDAGMFTIAGTGVYVRN